MKRMSFALLLVFAMLTLLGRATLAETPPPPTRPAVVFDDPDTPLCLHNAQRLTVWGTIYLSSGATAYLQTSWYVVWPEDVPTEYKNFHYQETGPVTNGQRFSVDVWWPGIRPSDTLAEIHIGAILLDESRNPIDGSSASLDYYWYPWVCPPPEKAALGDFIWHDLNGNGIQDENDTGIEGVTVELYTCAGDLAASTMTDAQGRYWFDDLMPGDYYVKFIAPEGYAFSPQDQGGDNALDSDAAPTTGRTVCTTLTAGETDTTWDAGLYRTPHPSPGTGTPGYWKNHPEAWLVKEITIGGITYSKEQAIALMGMPDGDKSYTLFRALVSAKLNVLIGNDASCIADTIASADAWTAAHPAGSKVKASSNAWKMGEPLYLTLNDYNNGLLCAPHRD